MSSVGVPEWRHRLSSLGPALFFLVAVVVGGWFLFDQREQVSQAVGQVSPGNVLLAGAFALLGSLAIFRCWFVVVEDVGADLSPRQGFGVFAVGQIGKYIPGSVWSVLGPAHFARRYGGAALSVGAATLISLVISVAVALALGGILLPAAADIPPALRLAPVLGLGIAALLVPRCLSGLLGLVAWVIRRPVLDRPISGSAIWRSAGWAFVANACFGAHIFLLGHVFGMGSVRGYLLGVCGYALAAGIGVLVVLAPAGVGAREGVLVLLLASTMSTAAAVTVALLSRAVTVVAEFALAAGQLRALSRASREG